MRVVGLEHPDAAVPEEEQVVDGLSGGGVVVDVHRRVGRTLAARGHDVHAHRRQLVLLVGVDLEADDDDRVDLAPRREAGEEVAPLLGVGDVVEQHVEVGGVEDPDEPLDDLAEEPAGEVRDDDGHAPAGALGQAGGLGGDDVVELRGDPQDALAGGGGDVLAAAEGARGGADADARETGDLDDRHLAGGLGLAGHARSVTDG